MKVSLDSLIRCPCITCEKLRKCDQGLNPGPEHCGALTRWIEEEAREDTDCDEEVSSEE